MRSVRVWLAALACACEAERPAPPPPPPPVENPPLEAPPEAPPEPAPTFEEIAPGTDDPPAQPSTRADSEKHAPPWAAGEPFEFADEVSRDLFSLAGGEPITAGALVGAPIVCLIGVDTETDRVGLFSLPDLRTTLTLGGNPRSEVRGEEDRSSMVITTPLASLVPGDTIRARVADRDVFRDRPIGTVSGKYGGVTPWVARNRSVEVECRALVGAAREQALAGRLTWADAQLTRLARHRDPPADADDLAFFTVEVAKARDAVRSAASIVGWSDPRVQRRLEWLGRIERRRAEAAAPLLARWRDAAAPAGEDATIVEGAFRGRVEAWSCGPETLRRVERAAGLRTRVAEVRGGCALFLEIAAVGRVSLPVQTFNAPMVGLSNPRLALADGQIVELEPFVLFGVTPHEVSSPEITPGQRGTVALIPRARHAAAGPAPVLVEIGAGDGPRTRLRVPAPADPDVAGGAANAGTGREVGRR